MSGFRVIVADDEPLARTMVKALLEADPEIASVAQCADATEVRQVIEHEGADIVFLDVEMPEVDGIRIARGLNGPDPVVVFVTAFSQYATLAFDVHAVDYVLKPFSDARFREAVARAKQRVRERRSLGAAATPRGIDSPSGPAAGREPADQLVFRDGDRPVFIRTTDIVWIEAQDYYVLVHTRHGRHLLRATLASLETRLDPQRFVRAHRAAIVNLDAVGAWLDRGGGELTMTDGTAITVSRSRRKAIAAAVASRLSSAGR